MYLTSSFTWPETVHRQEPGLGPRLFLEIVRGHWHNGQEMTKTELQLALAEATQTNKKTAGIFLDALGTLA